MPLTKADLLDVDFLDAPELKSDGRRTTSTAVYMETLGVSTTAATKTVVSNLSADGEGFITGRDHPVEAGDLLVISGSLPGGAADGTYTVATIESDTSVTVVESIADSTLGTYVWVYPAGASKVGFNPTKQNVTSASACSQVLTDLANHDLLNNEPVGVGVTYSNTRVGGKVTQERWARTSNARLIRQLDYTYTGDKLTSEVRKVFAEADGTTVLAQVSITYVYTGNEVTGQLTIRNV